MQKLDTHPKYPLKESSPVSGFLLSFKCTIWSIPLTTASSQKQPGAWQTSYSPLQITINREIKSMPLPL